MKRLLIGLLMILTIACQSEQAAVPQDTSQDTEQDTAQPAENAQAEVDEPEVLDETIDQDIELMEEEDIDFDSGSFEDW